MPLTVPLPPTPSDAPNAGRSDTSELVLLEQVRLLYRNLPASQAVALINAVVLALVLSGAAERLRVAAWLISFFLVTIARIFGGVVFRRAAPAATDIRRWKTYFFVGAVASGVLWGSTALILHPADSVVHQVFIAFVLGGMTAGGAAVLAPVFPIFVLFAVTALSPLIVRYFFVGNEIHYAMSGMGAIFLLTMLVMGRRIHKTIRESLALRFENDALVDYLTRAREHLQSANTELRATEEALRTSNEELESRVAERTAELEALDRRKDEFLAMLSHELRNPLAPIRNSIYMLERVDAASAQGRLARAIIERQTRYLTRLVDDLLDVTRILRGKIELRRERVNLTDLVGRTAEDHSAMFKALDLRLVIELPHTPLHSEVDQTRIAQVIGNLLQNAAKFTAAKGVVTVSLREADGGVEVCVRDTGCGIDADLLPGLFQPFTQGTRSRARTEGGLGLGLALVKGIVELHGGTVTAYSGGPGKGSTFTVRLPLAPAQVVAEGRPTETARTARHRRILIVDDNRDAADSLAQLVELFGHSADVAYDGPSAIDKAESMRPDIVLCDLGLPEMTGYDVARALRARGMHMRLIAVSGYAQPEDVKAAAAAGFEAHVTKPADLETIWRLLE